MRAGGLNQEDAWQRSVEFLFERLAVRWEIAGTEPIERQRELLARYRFAGGDERAWIREVAAHAPRRALPGPRGAVRIVDLSVPTGPGPGEPLPPTIEYEDHAALGAAADPDLRLRALRPARRPGLGVGDGDADHPRGHARRRAVPLLPDLRRRAGAHDRRAAARLVPAPRRAARPARAAVGRADRGRAPRGRAGRRGPHARALRHRAAVDRRRAGVGHAPSTSTPAPASRARRRRGCSSRA